VEVDCGHRVLLVLDEPILVPTMSAPHVLRIPANGSAASPN
jgi:hypothetical protein